MFPVATDLPHWVTSASDFKSLDLLLFGHYIFIWPWKGHQGQCHLCKARVTLITVYVSMTYISRWEGMDGQYSIFWQKYHVGKAEGNKKQWHEEKLITISVLLQKQQTSKKWVSFLIISFTIIENMSYYPSLLHK